MEDYIRPGIGGLFAWDKKIKCAGLFHMEAGIWDVPVGRNKTIEFEKKDNGFKKNRVWKKRLWSLIEKKDNEVWKKRQWSLWKKYNGV